MQLLIIVNNSDSVSGVLPVLYCNICVIIIHGHCLGNNTIDFHPGGCLAVVSLTVHPKQGHIGKL